MNISDIVSQLNDVRNEILFTVDNFIEHCSSWLKVRILEYDCNKNYCTDKVIKEGYVIGPVQSQSAIWDIYNDIDTSHYIIDSFYVSFDTLFGEHYLILDIYSLTD